MVKKLIIIHHNDLDGFSSGKITEYYYINDKKYNVKDIKFIECNYSGKENTEIQKLLNSKTDQDLEIVMVDCTLSIKEMKDIKKKYPNLIWIDHHASAIKDSIENGYFDMKGIRYSDDDEKKSATLLTFEFFYPRNKVNKSIQMISDFDTFNYKKHDYFYNTVMPYFYGVNLHCYNIEDYDIKYLGLDINEKELDKLITSTLEDGNKIKRYVDELNDKNCRANLFELEIDGRKCLCLNSSNKGSMNFDSAKELFDKYDFKMVFNFTGTDWNCSLYECNKKHSCAATAKKFGGGGHVGSAGFRLNTEDFEKLIKKANKIELK